MFLFLQLLACTPGESDQPHDTDVVTDTDTGVEVDACTKLGLPIRPFDNTGPSTYRRHEPAGDFTVRLRKEDDFTLSEQWTGCDTYLFVPHWLPVSPQDNSSFWTTGVRKLLNRSPKNVHYFFVVAGSSDDAALEKEMRNEILQGLESDDEGWWDGRLHVVKGPSNEQQGLVKEMFASAVGQYGWAIDGEQKIRTLGSMADVDAFDNGLYNAGEWPFERRLYAVANEALYFNFELERKAILEATKDTIVPIFSGDVVEQYVDGTVSLPDGGTMAGFDTLEIDVRMECPDPDAQEIGNCGAWDYLAHLWLRSEDDTQWLEMGRFITTYHRESRWVADASHALAWLGEGGERQVRYEWAPSWNTQPTGVTVSLRLSNQGKKATPDEIVPLFVGGSFNSTYNDRDPVEVDIPSDAVKVELVAITTGHGGATDNCAEFCVHSHHYTVGSTTFDQVFTEPGDDRGCSDTVNTGTVPNQAGTWRYGRGGWCPGRRVDPFVVDVTSKAPPGQTATIGYEAKIDGGPPFDDAGSIEHRSWLVISR